MGLLFCFIGIGLDGKGGDKFILLLGSNYPLHGWWNNRYSGLRDHGLEEMIHNGTGNEEMPTHPGLDDLGPHPDFNSAVSP